MSDSTPGLTLRVMVERQVSWRTGIPAPASQANILDHLRDGLSRNLPPDWSIAEGRGLTDEALTIIARALHSYSRSQRSLAEKHRHFPPMEPAEREWLFSEAETAGALAYELDARLKESS